MDVVLVFYHLPVRLKLQHINSGVDDGIFKSWGSAERRC